MDSLLISYLIVCITSFICVLLGNKLLHPKSTLFISLCYLGFIVFFLGRFYEVSRILLKIDIYNMFELGFLGIIGTFSFWFSSNYAIKQEINIKTNKSIIVKSLVFSLIVGLLYFIILVGNVNTLEKIIDLIVTLFAILNIYFFTKHILLIKEDKTGILKSLKLYNILGIIFSILILLLCISFAHDLNILLIIVSILISIVLLAMILEFKKEVKE